MTTLTYPSDQFPGPPSVEIDIPPSWSAVRIPGTLVAARQRDAEGDFAPNLVVRGFERRADFTTGLALAELQAFIDTKTDGTMDQPFEVDLGGVPFTGINVSWTDEVVGDIVQTHLFSGARRGQLVDLLQVTGSVGGSEVGPAYEQLQSVMMTVRVTR